MIRRTSWRYYHRDHVEIAGRVARWMAEELGWDDGQLHTELARYRQLVGAAAVPMPHLLTGNNGNGHAPHETKVAATAHRDEVDEPDNVAT
jgi:hypothetical protein